MNRRIISVSETGKTRIMKPIGISDYSNFEWIISHTGLSRKTASSHWNKVSVSEPIYSYRYGPRYFLGFTCALVWEQDINTPSVTVSRTASISKETVVKTWVLLNCSNPREVGVRNIELSRWITRKDTSCARSKARRLSAPSRFTHPLAVTSNDIFSTLLRWETSATTMKRIFGSKLPTWTTPGQYPVCAPLQTLSTSSEGQMMTAFKIRSKLLLIRAARPN